MRDPRRCGSNRLGAELGRSLGSRCGGSGLGGSSEVGIPLGPAGACEGCTRGDAPALRISPYVLGPPERLARILLYGLQGPLEVDGGLRDAETPAFAAAELESLTSRTPTPEQRPFRPIVRD